MHVEREDFMKTYLKLGLTVLLIAAFCLLSGFRAQTIIHDDGSETQDVLKVSESASGQKKLRADADEFQKRNYTIMDYDNDNGKGFRAMKTITKDGANRSSVDRVVHKTHDGFFCSTYYIDYNFTADSIKELRLGMPIEENGADLEYIVSFPSGTNVKSNASKADDQGSTYMWSLNNSSPSKISLQATVWHKLAIYVALFAIAAILLFVIIMEIRRRNTISWKRAAHMRRVEILALLLPLIIFGYMGYEYYTGTHITSDALAKVSQQKQEELLESREEDKKLHDADTKKQRSDELSMSKIRSKTLELSSALRDLNRNYQSGRISRSGARSEAASVASQVQEMLDSSKGLSQADRDELLHLIEEAESLASEQSSSSQEEVRSAVSDEQRRADAIASDTTAAASGPDSREADTVRGDSASSKTDRTADNNKSKAAEKAKSDK